MKKEELIYYQLYHIIIVALVGSLYNYILIYIIKVSYFFNISDGYTKYLVLYNN